MERIKQLLVLVMALAMVFGFNAVAMANALEPLKIWEGGVSAFDPNDWPFGPEDCPGTYLRGVYTDSAPGRTAGTYSWDAGSTLLGTPHDFVKIEREANWLGEKVYYTFSMDNVDNPNADYKWVAIQTEWFNTQNLYYGTGSYNLLEPEGWDSEIIGSAYVWDMDSNGEYDTMTAEWKVTKDGKGCPPWEAFWQYDWTDGSGDPGDRWYIEYAEMRSCCVPIPIPGTLLLLGSGLAGLAGIRRKFSQRA